ncbi:hypothetical protein NO2_0576 [Candidatus Termititenax persephonae]|uniref:Uncharacterized protein n=1 Tax=Candidatus Termititenax persephonae TaxID=2218525 RepID=A0A388TI03_9BACT|nr:hypothetical protein NO2_0576 [Candidatus Termititenax persephonae]
MASAYTGSYAGIVKGEKAEGAYDTYDTSTYYASVFRHNFITPLNRNMSIGFRLTRTA